MSRAGWITYKCDECGTEWTELTRDALSPSGETCINAQGRSAAIECDSYPGNCRPQSGEVHGWPLDVVDAMLSQGRVVRV